MQTSEHHRPTSFPRVRCMLLFGLGTVLARSRFGRRGPRVAVPRPSRCCCSLSLQLISVNWGAVQHTAEQVWTDPHGVTVADRLWAILTANLPFGGGFVTGFVLGFKLG